MAGRGPAPKTDRNRSGAPARGEWTPSPDGGWQHPLPPPPAGLMPSRWRSGRPGSGRGGPATGVPTTCPACASSSASGTGSTAATSSAGRAAPAHGLLWHHPQGPAGPPLGATGPQAAELLGERQRAANPGPDYSHLRATSERPSIKERMKAADAEDRRRSKAQLRDIEAEDRPASRFERIIGDDGATQRPHRSRFEDLPGGSGG